MELASLADAAPPGHQEFLNILANGSGAGCGKAAMIQTILLEQDFGQRYKAPLGAAEEQPCSSQANITFRYPLDIDAMFMSNPPSPSAAPEGDSDVAASASESGPSMPTQRPRWLQEISDAETIDSHHQPPAKKRDKDEVSSGNSPDDCKKPTFDVSAPVAPPPSTSPVYRGLSCNALVSGSIAIQKAEAELKRALTSET